MIGTAIRVSAILVTLANIVRLACWVYRDGWSKLRAVTSWAYTAAATCVQSFRRLWKKHNQVYDELLRFRQEHERRVATLGLVVALAVLQLQVIVYILPEATGNRSSLQDIAVVVTAAGALAGLSIPQAIQARTQSIWYFVFMAMATTISSVAAINSEEFGMFERMFAFRLATIAVSRSTGLVAAFNIAFIAVVSVQFKYSARFQDRLFPFVQDELVATSIYVGLHLSLQKWLDLHMELHRLHSKVMNPKTDLSAATCLLDAMCDVVFELDVDLKLPKHSRRLASLLLCSADRSLEGVKFEKFLATEADKATFDWHMDTEIYNATCTSSSPVRMAANIFQLNLRDSVANTVKMRCFHVRTCSTGRGNVRHVLGLRDKAAESQESSGESSVSDVGPLRSDSRSDTKRLIGVERDCSEPVIVTFNATSWHVYHASPSVHSVLKCRCSEGSCLREILQDPKNENFFDRFATKIERFTTGKDSSDQAVFRNVVVHRGRSGKSVTATLRMDFTMPTWSDDSDDMEEARGAPIVKAIFTDIRQIASSGQGGPSEQQLRRGSGPQSDSAGVDSGSSHGIKRETLHEL